MKIVYLKKFKPAETLKTFSSFSYNIYLLKIEIQIFSFHVFVIFNGKRLKARDSI